MLNSMLKRNKRSALGISINAIVYIVLAMALIGVGIFVINKVVKGSAGVVQIRPIPGIEPDAEHPVIGPPDNFKVKGDKKFQLNFLVYNRFNREVEVRFESLECINQSGILVRLDTTAPDAIRTAPLRLNPHEKKDFHIVVDPTKTFTLGLGFSTDDIIPCTATIKFSGGAVNENRSLSFTIYVE